MVGTRMGHAWSKSLAVIALVLALAMVTVPASASTAPRHRSHHRAEHHAVVNRYCLGHAHACRAGFHRVTERGTAVRVVRVRRDGRMVRVRRRVEVRFVACVRTHKARAKTTGAIFARAASVATAVPTAGAPVTVRAAIDPNFTQDPTNPLRVTFTYSAADAQDASTVPDGTIDLHVYETGVVGPSGGCSANVGGSVTAATCTLTVPAYGDYTLITTYSGRTGVASTSATETVDVTDPSAAAAPATVSAPTTIATSVRVSIGTEMPHGDVPVGATVTDANGNAVSTGTVAYAFSFGTVGVRGLTQPTISAPVGVTCVIVVAQVSNGWSVSSTTAGCTGGGTYTTTGTLAPPIYVTASYSGAGVDLASTSAQTSFP